MPNQLQTKHNKPYRGHIAYLNVFTMRFLGWTFDRIAHETGYNSSYLRSLFMEGGKLHDPWQEFMAKASETSLKEASAVMFGRLPDIVRTMADTAMVPISMEGVIAGKTIMEYTIGKPVERQKSDMAQDFTTASLVERVALRRKTQQNDDTTRGRTTGEGVGE